jgi:oligopeptide transport system ATP-binding protein
MTLQPVSVEPTPPTTALPAAHADAGTTTTDAILRVEHLRMYFPIRRGVLQRRVGWVQAVDDVTFEVAKGETLGLVGESGCGKSTVGRAILRLYRPTDGRVLFEGRDLADANPREMRRLRRHMQIIFQDPYASLDSRLTVGSIVAEPLEIHHVGSARDRRERVDELLRLVGLDPTVAGRFPHEFSGGQRQRIGIARAIALNPSFIVCDEPISALDVSIQAQVVNLLQRLQEELDLTYLFIAHDLSVVRHLSDRVAVMYLGKIVEITTRDALYGRPLHPYTMALLSAVPIPDPVAERRRRRLILTGDVPSPADPPAGCRFHTRCPFAADRCRTEEPALRQAEQGHTVACHFWDEINARGGIASLPVSSTTGASVTASPYLSEDEGIGAVGERPDQVPSPMSEPAIGGTPLVGAPGARDATGLSEEIDVPQRPD